MAYPQATQGVGLSATIFLRLVQLEITCCAKRISAAIPYASITEVFELMTCYLENSLLNFKFYLADYYRIFKP